MVGARSRPGWNRWVVITVLMIAGGFCALFVVVAVRVQPRNASEISTSTQESWGRFLLEVYAPRRENPQADCVTRLQLIADSLTAELDAAPVHVSVGLDSTINAVSLPGRHVVVYDGLLHDVESENEITMILAHEIGHFEANHIVEAFGRRMFLTMAAMGAGQLPVLGPILIQLGELGELSFSREAEREADSIGLEILHEYYGHVGGSTEFFERRLEEGEFGAAMEFFSTHPLSRKRIEAIMEQARNEGWPTEASLPALEPCATTALD